MKPSRAAFALGIGGVALVAGLVLLLWPSAGGAPLRGPLRPIDQERAADSGEPEPPASAPESAQPRTISPRPFDPRAETRKAAPDDPAAADAAPVVITGIVLDFDRKPAAGANVILYVAQDDVPVSSDRFTSTDGDGRFTLTITRPFPRDWILAAFRYMRRPATMRRRGEPTEPFELVLGEGFTIEGTVTIDGKPAREARVSASLQARMSPSTPDALVRDNLGWTGQAFEARRVQTACDDTGRFRLEGLAQAEYQLEGQQLERVRMFVVNPRVVARAPATGVRLELVTARVRVKVMGDGKVLDRARVAMLASDGRELRSDSGEFADLRVAPGVAITIDAAAAEFAPKTVSVPPLAPGETRDVEIVLDPASSPRLELRLQGATALGLKGVIVKFVTTAKPEENENRALKDVRQVLLARSTKEDEFVLERVPHPPGKYLLVVIGSTSSWLLPIQKEVVLPATGVLEVSADAIAGGNFSVTARDPAGNPVPGELVLRDLNGAEIMTRSFGPGASGTSFGPSGTRVEAAEFSRTSGVLPAGTYDLEVKCEGFKPVRRQVTVKAQSLLVEDVRLERP